MWALVYNELGGTGDDVAPACGSCPGYTWYTVRACADTHGCGLFSDVKFTKIVKLVRGLLKCH